MDSDLEHLWKIKEYISNYIQFADTKAGLVVGLSTLNAALLAIFPDKTSEIERAFLISSCLLLLFSLICAIKCIEPRLKSKDKNNIFWGDIAAYSSYETFKEQLIKSDGREDLYKQIFTLAKIAQYKYQWLSNSIRYQAVGLTLFWLIIFWSRLF